MPKGVVILLREVLRYEARVGNWQLALRQAQDLTTTGDDENLTAVTNGDNRRSAYGW